MLQLGGPLIADPDCKSLHWGLAARAARDAERSGVLQLGRAAQAVPQAPAQQPAAVHQIERKRAKHQACAGCSFKFLDKAAGKCVAACYVTLAGPPCDALGRLCKG